MDYFKQPISEYIWNLKYRFQHAHEVFDHSIVDTWKRVAHAIAYAEKPRQRAYWEKVFYGLLENFHFLPGGRILAGAGTGRKVTLYNCFVMNIAKDTLASIFEALAEGAFTLQQGGGIGYDFSILRPQGQMAGQTGSIASGPVSFMRIWDAMSTTMQSSGARRGAMMATLRCDHPDIETFIAAKANTTQLRQFNVSVIVTDEFMRAVRDNGEWALVFPVNENTRKSDKIIRRHWSGSQKPVPCQVYRYVKAGELWQKIIMAAYTYAEPGVLFEDTINRMNPLGYCEWISATNPCGEIPLPAYGACNLGSINLAQFVKNPFSDIATVHWTLLEITAQHATRFLDNVITVSKYPLQAQRVQALATRRMGLGFTGLADMFVMLGIRYGSTESLELAAKLMQTIAYATWDTSIELAREKGKFPAYRKTPYLQGEFVKNLPLVMQKKIARYGLRNSHHNAIAPTGTISLLANNVSSGIEPIFGAHYERRVRNERGELLKFQLSDYAFQLWQQQAGGLPPTWADVQSLLPENHLQMQAAVQPYVDNAISKTINLPEDFPFEKLSEVYTEAHKMGLKGCTVFRPNPITGGVITSEEVDRCGAIKGC